MAPEVIKRSFSVKHHFVRSVAKKWVIVTLLLILSGCSYYIPQQIPTSLAPADGQPAKNTPVGTKTEQPRSSTVTPLATSSTQGQIQTPSPAPFLQPSPTIQEYVDFPRLLRMVDPNTGWAYTRPFAHPENGRILHTSEGITSWIDVTPPISDTNTIIRAASFIDANLAFAVTSHSFMSQSTELEVIPWRSTDGGQTWQAGEKMLESALVFRPIELFFIDQEHGWMVGEIEGGMKNLWVTLFFYP